MTPRRSRRQQTRDQHDHRCTRQAGDQGQRQCPVQL